LATRWPAGGLGVASWASPAANCAQDRRQRARACAAASLAGLCASQRPFYHGTAAGAARVGVLASPCRVWAAQRPIYRGQRRCVLGQTSGLLLAPVQGRFSPMSGYQSPASGAAWGNVARLFAVKRRVPRFSRGLMVLAGPGWRGLGQATRFVSRHVGRSALVPRGRTAGETPRL
jgi:hypothetical protein